VSLYKRFKKKFLIAHTKNGILHYKSGDFFPYTHNLKPEFIDKA